MLSEKTLILRNSTNGRADPIVPLLTPSDPIPCVGHLQAVHLLRPIRLLVCFSASIKHVLTKHGKTMNKAVSISIHSFFFALAAVRIGSSLHDRLAKRRALSL